MSQKGSKGKGKKIHQPNDVLTLKGGAAQTTTHPGNLFFYKLCEERYEEFQKIYNRPGKFTKKNDGRLMRLAESIVDVIVLEKGGKFYDLKGRVMTRERAAIKVTDRFRQISKPKIVASAKAGDNDVVLGCTGGTYQLYKGNNRFGELLKNRYLQLYWPELFDASCPVIKGPKDNPRSKRKENLLTEIVQTVQNQWGGVFRDNYSLRVMTDEDAKEKIHRRLRDMRKKIKQQKVAVEEETKNYHKEEFTCDNNRGCGEGGGDRGVGEGGDNQTTTTATMSSDASDSNGGGEESTVTTAGATRETMTTTTTTTTIATTVTINQTLPRGGCTSIRKGVATDNREQLLVDRDKQYRINNDDYVIPQKKIKIKKKRRKVSEDDDEEGEGEGESDYYDSSDSEIEERDEQEEEAIADHAAEVTKQKQDQDREERLKRRQQRLLLSDPESKMLLPKKSKRRKSNAAVSEKQKQSSFVPLPPEKLEQMSNYERLRYQNMKRNHERLVKLGLL